MILILGCSYQETTEIAEPVAVYASLSGFVFDDITGKPIPHATIDYYGIVTACDESGEYELDQIWDKPAKFKVIADGYENFETYAYFPQTKSVFEDFTVDVRFNVTLYPL